MPEQEVALVARNIDHREVRIVIAVQETEVKRFILRLLLDPFVERFVKPRD